MEFSVNHPILFLLVGVIIAVGVLALSAASVIAAVVLPKKRNRKK